MASTNHHLFDYDAIPDEVWGRLGRAADTPGHTLRLWVLATVRPDGVPEARCMVLRGAHRRTSRIWFHTDRRSEKVGT